VFPFSLCTTSNNTTFSLELEKITTSNLFRVSNKAFKFYIHKLCLFLSIVAGILSGFPFTSQYVFALISFYDTIKVTIMQLFPIGVIMLAETKISIARIRNFLLTNHQQKTETYNLLVKQRNLKHKFPGVELKNISVKWNAFIQEEVLTDVSFSADVGELVGVVGSAGSGKSTLLQVILKEIEPTRGSVDVEMNISYAPQEPWIFSASIKQNILFGEMFEESRYLKVLRVCALERDLSSFPFGDNTLVGERGVMLSGGQKARIGLARAVYRNAEIYLLDDPLSAVDAHVADHIFNECILKFLRNKCVVLVTHQVHFLRNATKIYFLKNGRVVRGDSSELFEGLGEKLEANSDKVALEESQTCNYSSQLEVKEDEGGGINSYKSYGLAGGKWMTCFVFVLFILVQLLSNIVDGLVTLWVNFHQDSFNLCPQLYRFFTDENYLSMYAILLIVFVFVCHGTVWVFVKYCKRASRNLHNNLLTKVVEGSMTFFNNHSSGRIINRFSKDMGMIDEFIPMTSMEVTTEILSTVGACAVVIIVNYWMVTPTLVLCFTSYVYYKIFQHTIKKIRRVEGISKCG
jgi:ATP-binding cassette subfamily C (CFTR/MRP) protein 4